jgi:hypothetical protein
MQPRRIQKLTCASMITDKNDVIFLDQISADHGVRNNRSVHQAIKIFIIEKQNAT